MSSQAPKGQGAQRNVNNRFDRYTYEPEEEDLETMKTQIIEVFPKTILNVVKSPDLPLDYSMNPYQGCEHGCSYCFARPTHEYWGYSAGIDFERKIMVKKKCSRTFGENISEKKLCSKNHNAFREYRLLSTY